MKDRSRVIIKDWNKILLVHRIKNWKDYYVIPWWWVYEWENIEQWAIREIQEETSLNIQIKQKLWEEEFKWEKYHYFLSTNFIGEIKLWWPEIKRQSENNVYILERVEIWNLMNTNLIPKNSIEKIINISS